MIGSRLAWKRPSPGRVLVGGSVLVVLAFLVASARGAYAIPVRDLLALTWSWVPGSSAPEAHDAARLVFLNIRLPRLLLAALAGAGLGLTGALMQGLFRNPLADPGLIGVSSGAALGAATAITLGAAWLPDLPRSLGSWTLVMLAFAGGLLVTGLIHGLARTEEGTRVSLMLLAGIAVNALAGAGLGYLTFIANDEQLRYVQFWLLGSLGGARWSAIALVAVLVIPGGIAALRLARPLDILALGEAQATLLGVDVERVQRQVVWITAIVVGAITATTGIIGFIGLVAPHGVRLLAGPDHRAVIPGSALLGAALVLVADAVARTWAQPAELPLGVLTASVGVPFFLLLLRMMRGRL